MPNRFHMEKGNVTVLHPLRLVVLPGRLHSTAARAAYNSAYETWKQVWSQTLSEVDKADSLPSDQFTRQDYLIGIFHGQRCAALCCFRRAELWFDGDFEDSWFKPWPQQALTDFSKTNETGIVVSSITIHSDYRRTNPDPHFKDLNVSSRLCESINFFLQSWDADIVFGITRNERSVNKMAEYTGFKVFKNDAVHHGEPADLIVADKKSLHSAQLQYPADAITLWEKRTQFSQEMIVLGDTDFRKLKIAG